MEKQRVILVTGVAGYWGRRLALRLLEEPDVRLLGVDQSMPAPPIDGLDFTQSGLQQALLLELLAAENPTAARVDTVIHLSPTPALAPGSSQARFEHNVMGTIHLFGACAQAGVRHLVAMSSTTVYGLLPDNPVLLDEDQPLRASRTAGPGRYLRENEQFYANFRRTNPAITLAVLRFAHIVGPTADTAMTRFLRQPKAPVLLGFDPVLQFIHEEDVVEALAQAALEGADGAYNVAADDTMPLSRALGLVGKLPLAVPHPLAAWGQALLGEQLADYAPLDFDVLRYRCLGDTRLMRQELGFEPGHSAAEALRSLAEQGEQHRWQAMWEQASAQGEALRRIIEQYRAFGAAKGEDEDE